jgi:hypothetical protein
MVPHKEKGTALKFVGSPTIDDAIDYVLLLLMYNMWSCDGYIRRKIKYPFTVSYIRQIEDPALHGH